MSIGIASGARQVLASTAAECFLQYNGYMENIVSARGYISNIEDYCRSYWSRSQQEMFNKARHLIRRSSSVVYKTVLPGE